MIIKLKNRKKDFSTVMRPYMPALSGLACKLTGNKDDAEDLIQEFLIKVYPHQEKIESSDKIKPWLTKVLYHTYIDIWRRQKNNPVQALHEFDAPSDSNDEYFDKFIQETVCPAQLLVLNEQQQHILLMLNQLSNKHRILLILHDIEGYTLPEINRILDVPLGTLKSRLHRARAKFRDLLVSSQLCESEVIA